jgi:hypothetical protein
MSSTGIPPARAVVDRTIAPRFAPLLTSLGYRKRGLKFGRFTDECVFVVQLQTDARAAGSEQDITFAVNLGVSYRTLGDVRGLDLLRPMITHPSTENGRVPSESECTIRERLGWLLTGDDTWWTPGAEAEAEVVAAWERFGAPWMDALGSLAGGRAELERRGELLSAAVLSVASGDRPHARELVLAHLERKPRWAENNLEWCRLNGIEV